MEQRYHAVMEVLVSRVPVTEVAVRYGVSRKSVHAWLARYEAGGLPGLADRSHRPHAHPWRVAAEIEAAVCELRRRHPRWGPRRLVFELARQGVSPVPSRSTVYRVLVRHGLVDARSRKRRREDYRRWERDAPMQLWQLDVMGSVFLSGGAEVKLVTGIDDHSRFCVIAAVVPRATGRAVCAAFAAALAEYGCPEQVLTDNGRQFTGKFARSRPVEVLFDRICRSNGIEHLLTKVRSPTTTGKIERWHQTSQREFLDEAGPFDSVPAAQAAMDAWRAEYNHTRPHQSLGMATPASRFTALSRTERDRLPIWLPPDLAPAPQSAALPDGSVPPPRAALEAADAPVATVEEQAEALTVDADAVEIDRVVPPSGNLTVCQQQFWFGPANAGMPVRLWIDTTTVHVNLDGMHHKTLPSRMSRLDLARLRANGAAPAGPPPARPSPGMLAGGATIELDRTVTPSGVIGLAGRWLPVGVPFAGQRVTLRLEAHLCHVVDRGVLVRTLPLTLPAKARARLQGARVAGPPPAPPSGPVRVQRRVSSRGGIQVVKQRVHVGFPHAGKTVTIEVEENVLRVLDADHTVLKVVPRTSREEVTRYKVYGHTKPTTG